MLAITPNILAKFLNFCSKYVFILSLFLFSISAILIILLENDYYQGISFKIMFVHVPTAWLSLLIFFTMGVSSIIGLVFKSPTSFTISRALSPIGLIMSIIVLITGSIWGNLTWGTYWVWDARLTSMLILAFIYLGHILLLNSFDHFQKSDFAASILAIIGLVNLPIVKFSVDWWTTLHQGASVFKVGGPSMTNDYLITLLLCFAALFSLCFYWFSNIFYIITESRRIERIKLLNQ
ncbi:heme ABC transporter permease CcmC [Alphaproteobacteria bacterium]|jgi:heme exporter protein C|nr:heme ABC transporter permease CcmC [Alphaproteobacteria bacterium]